MWLDKRTFGKTVDSRLGQGYSLFIVDVDGLGEARYSGKVVPITLQPPLAKPVYGRDMQQTAPAW